MNLGYSKLDVPSGFGETWSPEGDQVSSYPWSIDQQTGKVTAGFTAGLDLKGNSLENVSRILSANGTWSIDENGKLIVKEIETGNLNVKNKTKFGTPESPQGITIYDRDTKKPYCVGIKTGEWVKINGECGE